MKKKLIIGAIFLSTLSFTFSAFSNDNDNDCIEPEMECRWATRETSSGWEAICIETGVGYICTCGSVKQY